MTSENTSTGILPGEAVEAMRDFSPEIQKYSRRTGKTQTFLITNTLVAALHLNGRVPATSATKNLSIAVDGNCSQAFLRSMQQAIKTLIRPEDIAEEREGLLRVKSGYSVTFSARKS